MVGWWIALHCIAQSGRSEGVQVASEFLLRWHAFTDRSFDGDGKYV
jgi:hypothetical protein